LSYSYNIHTRTVNANKLSTLTCKLSNLALSIPRHTPTSVVQLNPTPVAGKSKLAQHILCYRPYLELRTKCNLKYGVEANFLPQEIYLDKL